MRLFSHFDNLCTYIFTAKKFVILTQKWLYLIISGSLLFNTTQITKINKIIIIIFFTMFGLAPHIDNVSLINNCACMKCWSILKLTLL